MAGFEPALSCSQGRRPTVGTPVENRCLEGSCGFPFPCSLRSLHQRFRQRTGKREHTGRRPPRRLRRQPDRRATPAACQPAHKQAGRGRRCLSRPTGAVWQPHALGCSRRGGPTSWPWSQPPRKGTRDDNHPEVLSFRVACRPPHPEWRMVDDPDRDPPRVARGEAPELTEGRRRLIGPQMSLLDDQGPRLQSAAGAGRPD